MRRVYVFLASPPWWKFQRGEKTVEIRRVGTSVAYSVKKAQAAQAEGEDVEVVLRRGYNTPDELRGGLGGVWWVDAADELPTEVLEAASVGYHDARYYDPDAGVVAFEVLDIRRVKR